MLVSEFTGDLTADADFHCPWLDLLSSNVRYDSETPSRASSILLEGHVFGTARQGCCLRSLVRVLVGRRSCGEGEERVCS